MDEVDKSRGWFYIRQAQKYAEMPVQAYLSSYRKFNFALDEPRDGIISLHLSSS